MVITARITFNENGYRRTTIKVNSTNNSFFDYQKIRMINEFTRDTELTLLYSFIAFKLNAFQKLGEKSWVKEIDGRVWWETNAKLIAEHFAISERTAFRKLKQLEQLGLIQKKKIYLKSYYAINEQALLEIEKKYNEFLIKKQPSCTFVSELTDKNESHSLYNTYTDDKDIYINNNTKDSDIILNNKNDINVIGSELTKRQAAFLLSAIKITLRKVNGSVQEIFGWIKFSILNSCQRNGITTFKHAVNRFLKLLRENKLRMPFGYNKYTEEGREFWGEVLEREEAEKNQFNRDSTDIRSGAVEIKQITNNFIKTSTAIQAREEVEKNERGNVVENYARDNMSNRLDLGEFVIEQETFTQKRKRLLNESAERLAEEIVKESRNNTRKSRAWFDGMQDVLDKYLNNGADRQRVQQILNGIWVTR